MSPSGRCSCRLADMLLIALGLGCTADTSQPEGTAFSVQIDVRLAPNQTGLLDEIDTLELLVEYATGTETFPLSTADPGKSAEVVGIEPLSAETVALVGYTDGNVVAFGRSTALTVSEDELSTSLLLLRTDDFAWMDTPGRRAFGAAVATGGGEFWLSGGMIDSPDGDTSSAQDSWWQLSINADTTLEMTTAEGLLLPSLADEDDNAGNISVSGRMGHTMTLLDDGDVLIAGGGRDVYDSFAASFEGYRWTPGSTTVDSADNMRNGRSQHAAIVLPSGNVVLAGGYGVTGSETSFTFNLDFEFFDLNDGEFKQPEDLLTTGGVGLSGAPLGEDGALICGGVTLEGTDKAPFAVNSGCDLINLEGEIQPAAELPVSVAYHRMTALPDGSILLTGGVANAPGTNFENSSTLPIDASNEVYRYQNGAWSAVASMNNPRAFHAASLLPDGRVLVAGGAAYFEGIIYLNSPTALACAEIYDPDSDTWTDVSAGCNADTVTGDLYAAVMDPTWATDDEYGVLVVGGLNNDMPVSGAALFVAAPQL